MAKKKKNTGEGANLQHMSAATIPETPVHLGTCTTAPKTTIVIDTDTETTSLANDKGKNIRNDTVLPSPEVEDWMEDEATASQPPPRPTVAEASLPNNPTTALPENQHSLCCHGPECQGKCLEIVTQAQQPTNATCAMSPWLRNVGSFNIKPAPTKADLLLPKPNVQLVDNVLQLDENDYVPVSVGWGYSLLGCFAGKFPGRDAVHKLTSS